MSEFPSAIALSTLNGATGFRLDGFDFTGKSGRSVSGAGDVNGDGFADIIIGAHHADVPGDAAAGASYVVFGKAGGFSSTFALNSLNGTNGFRIDGKYSGDEAGRTVASAGDVNGDGFDDVIVAAYLANPHGIQDAGETYVVFGKADGFASAFDLSSIDGTNGFRLNGFERFRNSGSSAAGAGDVNGDGFADLLVGNRFASESYVVFGSASGFGLDLNLNNLDDSNGFRLAGSGYSVAGAGDVNGDGFDDMVIGTGTFGDSFVVFGKAGVFPSSINLGSLDGVNGFRVVGAGRAVSGAGDVNGDGLADLIVGAPASAPGGDTDAGSSYVVFGKTGGFGSSINVSSMDGSNGFRLDGIDAFDRSGRAVANAGDVNGDGFDDLLIGSTGADNYTGESYVVFGKAGGFSSAVDLASLDGVNGFRLNGVNTFDRSGESLARAGDVNGDGFGDIILGAYGFDFSTVQNSQEGVSYVIFGRAPDAAVNRTGAAADQYINGGAFNDTISGLGGDDRLEGRAGADRLIGGDGNDAASYQHASASVTVDLTSAASSSGDAVGDTFTSIERFELTGFNDSFNGDAQGNGVFGLGGDDSLQGAGGDDRLRGGAGGDTLDGGFGTDTVDYTSAKAGVLVDLATPASRTGDAAGDVFIDIERFIGSKFGDVLSGDGAANALVGYRGDDLLKGGGGADALLGGAGGDSLDGGDGNDSLQGEDDADVLQGNNGNDRLVGGIGNDTLSGGNDADVLQGNNGNNMLAGGEGNDTLAGGNNDDSLQGGAGDDRLSGGAGGDTLDGGSGTDTVDFTSAKAGVLVDLATPAGGAGDAAGDVFIDIERFIGSKFGDVLSGDGAANALVGYRGDDWLKGGDGADALLGGAGGDSLDGGDGNDSLQGEDDADVLQGNNGNDRLVGGIGDDTLSGGNDADALYGQNGNNMLAGGEGNDTLAGGNNDDSLQGGAGNDRLEGNSGSDTMDGGAGRDIFSDSNGADVFRFASVADTGSSAATRDVIAGFSQADDLIDLPGAVAFVSGFTGSGAAEIRSQTFAGSNYTIVFGDTNGDKTVDFQLQLNGLYTLSAADFI